MVHIRILGKTWEVEAAELVVPSHPRLPSNYETNLSSMSLFLKKAKQNKELKTRSGVKSTC